MIMLGLRFSHEPPHENTCTVAPLLADEARFVPGHGKIMLV
jgi:hypothetical protein